MPLKKDERIELRAPSADVKRWRAAAEAQQMTLSDWMRRTLNASLPAPTKKGAK